MLVVMKPSATREELEGVLARVERLGLPAHTIMESERTAVAIGGHRGPIPAGCLQSLPGVAAVVPLSQPFRLVSRETKREDTVVDFGGGLTLGGGAFCVMAGPCAVESREQILSAARSVRDAGATFLRGGAFKARTSPYAFRGLGEEGLVLLAEAREQTGLRIVTEARDKETLDVVAAHADLLQVGARNMQNYPLLQAVGRAGKPVLLKRGLSATIEELLLAAEYVLLEGNHDVILCERGIRTFETTTRNTLDLGAVAVLRQMTHLPVVVDPSHAIGIRGHVPALCRAAAALGCDGLLVEVHPDPDNALSDGAQSLTPDGFREMMMQVERIRGALRR